MNHKLLAISATLLMMCGVFLCCSVMDNDSSAVGESASNPIYIPLSTKSFTVSPGKYYEIQLCDLDAVQELELSLDLYIDNHLYGNHPGEGILDFTYSETNLDTVIVSFPSGLTGSGVLKFRFSEGYGTNNSDTRTLIFSLPQSTVTFNANGGSCSVSSSTVNNGTSITLPSVSKQYYSFSGWFTASSGGTRVGGAGDTYTVNDNITLYAQYNVIPVSITTSQSTAYVVQGSSFSYTVGTNPADATISVSGANWLTVSGKTVTGVPTASAAPAGTYHITVTATYGTQTSVQTFDIVVAEKLIFESVPTGGIIAVPA